MRINRERTLIKDNSIDATFLWSFILYNFILFILYLYLYLLYNFFNIR
jgi:hypothetical protein